MTGQADRWIRRTTMGCVGMLALIAGMVDSYCPFCGRVWVFRRVRVRLAALGWSEHGSWL